jgi:sulfite reductase alpha subunit-like flavoprotein
MNRFLPKIEKNDKAQKLILIIVCSTTGNGDMPENFGTMTPEEQDEQAQEEANKRNKVMPLSRNGEDIENSKRSRGERL